jgi:hypothetical protein
LDAIYEQITRGAARHSYLAGRSDLSDEHDNHQVYTDSSLGYSHLAAQLIDHKRDLQNARMWRETERLKALISTLEASHLEQQGWEDIAADAKARCAEAETTASKLRVDLAAAIDCVRNVQEQLDDQIELGSGKDILIQSIAEESLTAHTRLKCAEDEINRLDAELLDEQLRRLLETKELLDELIMVQDRHEDELRRLSQEALDTLRDTPVQLRQPPLDFDYPPRYQPSTTTWPYDTGQPPLPPEHILDTGTLPVSSFIDPNSSFRSTQWSPHIPSQDQDSSTRQAALPINSCFNADSSFCSTQWSPNQDQDSSTRLAALPFSSSINANSSFCSTQWSPHLPTKDRDSSTRLAARLLGCWDQESEVDEDQRAALEELIELMCRVEPPGVQDVKPSDHDETRLREESIVTKEQLRLTEEQIIDAVTPPISSSLNDDSSFRSTQWLPHSPSQDRDSSTRLAARLLGFWGQESEVDEDQRAALEELIELMCRVEPPGVQDVKPSEQDETRLREELIVTKEQLRLTEEEVRDVRRELDQSKETLHDVGTHVMALEYELDICQATLREAQHAQHVSEVELAEAVQLLRLRQAESESSMARAEAPEFKCSQTTFLCAALQVRVTELEDQVKNLKNSQKCPAIAAAHTNSHSFCPTAIYTGMHAPDLPRLGCSCIPVPLDPGIRDSESVYMTVPSSMPRLFDLSLPPSSLPTSDGSLYLSYPNCSAIPLAYSNSLSLRLADIGTLTPGSRHSCMLTYPCAIRF